MVDVVWRFAPEAAARAREFLFHPRQKLESEKDGRCVSFVGYESVEQAVRIVHRHPTSGRTLPRRKNEALRLLLRTLREADIDV